jgi:hypothetical protein
MIFGRDGKKYLMGGLLFSKDSSVESSIYVRGVNLK